MKKLNVILLSAAMALGGSSVYAASQHLTVSLKAYNNLIVTAENGGGGRLIANRAIIGAWEKLSFKPLDMGALQSGGRIAIRVHNGKFVAADNGGGGAVIADRDIASTWEIVTIRHADGSGGPIQHGDRITLQAYYGQYLSAQIAGGGEVVADRIVAGPWEIFTLEVLDREVSVFPFESDLDYGHFMSTRGVMRADGRLEVETHTHTTTLLGGFTGGVQLLLVDDFGRTIGQSSVHQFGVDGKWIGRHERTDYWTEDLDPNLAVRVAEIHVYHFWSPRYQALKRIVDDAVSVARPIIEVIKDIQAAGGSAK